MAERAQGDVVRGPGADAGQGGPAFDEVLQRARGAEVDPAVEQGACDRVDRACARLGHAEARQVRCGDLRRLREQALQAGARQPRRQRRPVEAGQATRVRGGHAHLLAEHRAHRGLEPVPAAWQAQGRAPAQQRPQCRVAREHGADRLGIGVEVEHAPHPLHRRQHPRRWAAVQFQLQRAAIVACAAWPAADPEPAGAARVGEGPGVGLVARLTPGRALAQKVEGGGESYGGR